MAVSAQDLVLTIRAQDQASAALGGIGKSVSGLTGALGRVAETAAGFVVGQGLLQLPGLFADTVRAASESEAVMAATEAVIASTGSAAGLSADQVASLATDLSKVAPFDDEVIQGAENLLLTFTKIGGDIMPEATEAVLNMSQALGQDTKSSAIQLGKALNDPINGATALRRVGVALTDQQEEQIKAMVEAGDVAGAQGVILKELQTEFGGAAKAAGQTFGGQLKILQTQLGNVQEQIGGAVIPVLVNLLKAVQPLIQGFADKLPAALDVVTGAFSKIETVVSAVFAAFTRDAGALGIVNDVLHDVFGSAADQIQPFLQAFMDAIPAIQRFVSDVGTTLSTLGEIARAVFEGDFAGALEVFQALIDGTGGDLVVQLAEWGQAFLGWVLPMIPGLIAQLGDLRIQILTWLGQAAVVIVEGLAQWAAAFIEWVAPFIPPMLVALGQMLAQLSMWLISVALPAIVEKLGQWALAFIQWVAPLIPPLLLELGKMLIAVGNWFVTEAQPEFTRQLVAIGQKFWDWVGTTVMPALGAKLGEILTGIGNWITDPAIPAILGAAAAIGTAMLDGIRQGIANALEDFKNWLQENIVNAIPEFLRNALGLSQDTGVFARIGERIMEEIKVGIGNKAGDVQRALAGTLGGMTGVPFTGTGALGAEDAIRTALAILGLPAGWFDALRQIAIAESSLGLNLGPNPIPVGPNEEHATGLFQTIPSTFASNAFDGYADIWNFLDNSLAAIRYIQRTYGDPFTALRFQQSHGGYAEGGFVPGPFGRAQPAIVHGGELILNREQQRALGSGETHYHLHGPTSELLRLLEQQQREREFRNSMGLP